MDRLYIQKLFTSRVAGDAALYVGELGRMFFGQEDGILRLSNGSTPGGIIVGGGNNTPPISMVVSSLAGTIIGDIDGINNTFILPSIPVQNSLIWQVNGIIQTTFDYSIDNNLVTTNNPPQNTDVLAANYLMASGIANCIVASSLAGTIIGDINGINNTFILPSIPLQHSLLWQVNGVIQDITTYTIIGSVVIMNIAPQSTDVLSVNYLHI